MGNNYVKYKRLQKTARLSRMVIIPHVFLKHLKWTMQTQLSVHMDPVEKKIIITEIPNQENPEVTV